MSPTDTEAHMPNNPPPEFKVRDLTPLIPVVACDAGLHVAHPGETCAEHEADLAAMQGAWKLLTQPLQDEIDAMAAEGGAS